MENLIWGIVVFTVCLLLFFIAYRFYRNDKIGSSLTLIVIAGCLLRIFVSMDQYLHDWDEKYHALVAKNFFDDPSKPTLYKNPVIEYDHKNWTKNHVWLKKGPIPLIAIGASVKIFRTHAFAVRLPSILIGCLAIILTFFIGKYLFNLKVGLIAAFIHSIHGLSIELIGGRVSSDHVEIFFSFFIELAVFLSVYFIVIGKRKFFMSFLIGAVIGLAILSKWFPALVVLPIWLLAALISKEFSFKKLLVYFVVSVMGISIIVLPYFSYLNSFFHEEFNWIIKGVLFAYNDTLEHHAAPWYYYLNKMLVLFGEAIIIPLALSIWLVLKKKENWQIILLTTWWLIPVLVFSFAETKRFTYLIISAPAFFILIAYTVNYLSQNQTIFKRKTIGIILILALLILPIRYTIERTKMFVIRDNNVAWMDDIDKMKALSFDPKSTVIFNFPHYIEAMFHTDYTVYPDQLDAELIEKNHLSDFKLIVYNPEKHSFSEY